jgi:hemoglobin/transferrin/lactoferrin receptor protein
LIGMLLFLLRLVVCITVVSTSGFTQTDRTGSLEGVVTDPDGAAVSSVQVTLSSALGSIQHRVTTDAAGRYRFERLRPITYVLSIESSAFRAIRRTVTIEDGVAKRSDITLDVASVSESVTVTADTDGAANKIEVPQQLNAFSEEAIGQRTSAVLSQAADEETGISQQRTSSTIGAFIVRGLTEVGVYVDGVRYTNSTQRGGINTFFNLNEPTALRAIEVQRSPNTAQYGSDGLGGSAQLLSRMPELGFDKPQWGGEINTHFSSADLSYGSNTLITYGTRRFGFLANVVGRKVNDLRPGGGIDSHSAITRFLGLPSNVMGDNRLSGTGFTQYGGTFAFSFAPADDQQISFRYQRSQQDGGKRYDQLLGGDGNLIADLRNLMMDFGYLRYYKQDLGWFDVFSATVSYNSQREERQNQGGQGNPLASVTHEKERTTTWGASFFLDKQLGSNNLLFGADYYHDRVWAPAFSVDPSQGNLVTITRPRIPNGATYDLGGVYIQDVWQAIRDRLRVSGALRYNIAKYRSRSSEAPILNGQPLFPDDSLRSADVSGRIGATVSVTDGLYAAFNYSRGFRAPNITALGSVGLVGVGYQVSSADIAGRGATLGSTAGADAVDTGIPVDTLRSELSDNFDGSVRYRNRNFETSLSAFVIDYRDAIVRQTLILPQGAVGSFLGSQEITSQLATGAVFVDLSTSPVLTQANIDLARVKGLEAEAEYRFGDDWTLAGNFTYLRAEDSATGEPPSLGGAGFPPAYGFARLRYQPTGKKYWVEGYASAAGRQGRLSSLDLSDRRTGAARTRSQIQNFFRRGACVRGITTVGSNGQCGSAGGILIATGETLAQVQDRVLPGAATAAVPMFTAYPGYVLFGLRGGYRFDDRSTLNMEFDNIADKSHRMPGWGIDGPGQSLTLRYQFRF